MRVWLVQTVPGVGKAQTVVDVQPGYARNFLFARGLAVAMNPALEAQAQAAQQRTARQSAKRDAEFQRLHDALQGRSVVVPAKANGDRLFGSVTADQIRARIHEVYGVELPANAITLPHPFKTVGTQKIQLSLGPHATSVTVEIRAHA